MRHVQMALNPAHATVVARFPPILSLHRLSVTPVVATLSEATYATLVPSPAEVRAIFSLPLRHFLEAHPRHKFEDREVGGYKYRIHHFAHERWVVWGLTAGILIRVAEAAFGAKAEFDVTGPYIDYSQLYSADGHTIALKRRSPRRPP
jgi:peroxisomal coenzyme A diphosphatase NUDT7